MKEIYVITYVFCNNLNEFDSIVTQVRDNEAEALKCMTDIVNRYDSHSDVEYKPEGEDCLYKAYGYNEYSKMQATITYHLA